MTDAMYYEVATPPDAMYYEVGAPADPMYYEVAGTTAGSLLAEPHAAFSSIID